MCYIPISNQPLMKISASTKHWKPLLQEMALFVSLISLLLEKRWWFLNSRNILQLCLFDNFNLRYNFSCGTNRISENIKLFLLGVDLPPFYRASRNTFDVELLKGLFTNLLFTTPPFYLHGEKIGFFKSLNH